jgi:hypothetical protein
MMGTFFFICQPYLAKEEKRERRKTNAHEL